MTNEAEEINFFMTLGASIGLFGSGFIVITYTLLKSLRKNIHLELVFHLSLMDFIFALSSLLVTRVFEAFNWGCVIVVFIQQYAEVASFFWTSIIALNMYYIFQNPTGDIDNKRSKFYMQFCYIMPLAFIIFLLMQTIKGYDPKILTSCLYFQSIFDAAQDFQGAPFYLAPLTLCLMFNMLIYTKIWKHLNELMMNENKYIILHLALYPLMLWFCWMWGIIAYIYQIWTLKNLVWAQNMFYLLSRSQGLVNCIVYGFNYTVRRSIKTAVRTILAKRFKRTGSETEIRLM